MTVIRWPKPHIKKLLREAYHNWKKDNPDKPDKPNNEVMRENKKRFEDAKEIFTHFVEESSAEYFAEKGVISGTLHKGLENLWDSAIQSERERLRKIVEERKKSIYAWGFEANAKIESHDWFLSLLEDKEEKE